MFSDRAGAWLCSLLVAHGRSREARELFLSLVSLKPPTVLSLVFCALPYACLFVPSRVVQEANAGVNHRVA